MSDMTETVHTENVFFYHYCIRFTEIDFQYQAWKWGIILTDNVCSNIKYHMCTVHQPSLLHIIVFGSLFYYQSFLYICWCLMMSVLGNFNYFFFAAHLLDIATCFKSLGTILRSVTHNGKQVRPQNGNQGLMLCLKDTRGN